MIKKMKIFFMFALFIICCSGCAGNSKIDQDSNQMMCPEGYIWIDA